MSKKIQICEIELNDMAGSQASKFMREIHPIWCRKI